MGNHSCLWKHLRKESIQLKRSPITLPMVVCLQWFLMAWILMKYRFHSINSIYWLNVAFLFTFFDVV
jgi:hypothetical protein